MATVRVSNVQLAQLKAILRSHGSTIKLEDIASFNQLQLGSLKRRGYISETASKDGLHITKEGRQAIQAFEHADYLRKVTSTNLSCYLSLDLFSLDKNIDKSARKLKRLSTVATNKVIRMTRRA